MLKEKIAGYDEKIARLEKEIAAGREVKEEVKEDDAAAEKVKEDDADAEMKHAAAAGKKKKKRSKKRAAVPTGLGVSGFAPGENPHKGKFVFGKVGGWPGDLEWMMVVGMRK